MVILSLPRSGSSLLAGILHRLGINMGSMDHLNNRNFLNKFGCYEDLDFFLLNFRILAIAGELGRFRIQNEKNIEYLVKSQSKYLKNLIKEKEKPLWGWKDPSTVYTIPYFHNYLTNPYYICLHRNINDIVDSILRAANNIPNIFSIIFIYFRFLKLRTLIKIGFNYFSEFLKKGNPIRVRNFLRDIIIKIYKRIDSFVEDKKYLYVNLEDLVKNPSESIEQLTNFLEIQPSKKQISKALSFIHPELIKIE